jgi:hypothetical protein
MLFKQYIMINLVFTKSSGPKHHAVSFTGPIFYLDVFETNNLSTRQILKQ